VEPFHFTGKAGEYFGIWIVNLFLTIVTLGIYSAWAKVRKKRYFYGNTWVAGANFDYHGNPVAILKGRLLAFAAFVAYTLAGHYSPKVAALIALAIMPAVPWLLVRSFAFNALNSSHRNLRFHFRAGYREGFRAIWPLFLVPALVLVLPQLDPQAPPKEISAGMFVAALLPAIVLAVFYPYVVARVNRLRIDHGRYGTAPFACGARTGQFYVIYVIAGVLAFGAIFIMGALLGAGVALAQGAGVALAFVPVVYIVAFGLIFAFTRSRVSNLVFNSTVLAGRVRFASRLKARKLAAIYVGNAVAIVATVGLLIPWAAIRTARYRAECLQLECEGSLESFAADVAAHVSATGEEMGDMFDVDLSL
jgi:uncharacterized membrane protein YjgN (DUF898 family)